MGKCRLGDLYTLPVEGGKARRITSGLVASAWLREEPDRGPRFFNRGISGNKECPGAR